mmetsp:Transcript_21311/g.36631  ORF Transcript_21311/g.36631 Transcript_21311/m.36631 type:complete len:88 (-) Transcript_21311:323-586(-)
MKLHFGVTLIIFTFSSNFTPQSFSNCHSEHDENFQPCPFGQNSSIPKDATKDQFKSQTQKTCLLVMAIASLALPAKANNIYGQRSPK